MCVEIFLFATCLQRLLCVVNIFYLIGARGSLPRPSESGREADDSVNWCFQLSRLYRVKFEVRFKTLSSVANKNTIF